MKLTFVNLGLAFILEKKSKSTIRLMNILLATAPQLHSVRVTLRNEEENRNNELFKKLWDAWIFCPVSSICLALISGRYNLAYQTLKFISTQNIVEEDLVEFDRLIQLIESPGFTPLRFELLERPPVLTGKNWIFLWDFYRILYRILQIRGQWEFDRKGGKCDKCKTSIPRGNPNKYVRFRLIFRVIII